MRKRSAPNSSSNLSSSTPYESVRRDCRPSSAAPHGCYHSLSPPDLPDEVLISDVGRFHILSGHHTISETYQELFHCAPFSLNAWIPPHVEILASRLPGNVTENTRALLTHKTLFPLFQIFSALEFTRYRPEHRSAKERVEARRTSNRSTGDLIRAPKRLALEPTRICMECLHEDWKVYGTSYIHLSHQIPGVEVCAKHGVALIYKCLDCECRFVRPKQLALAPWRPCHCHRYLAEFKEPRAKSSDLVALSYARFTSALLSAPPTLIQSEALIAAYKQRAHELGCTRGANVDRNRLFKEIEHYYGENLLEKADSAYQKKRLSGWFNLTQDRYTSEVPLGRHLLFAHFLFRDEDQFWQTVLHPIATPLVTDDEQSQREQSMPSRSSKKKTAAVQTKAKRVQELRRKILWKARETGKCTIDDLWANSFGLMKQLASLDTNAIRRLKEQLKAIKPSCTPTQVKIVNPHPEDEARARKIYEAAEKLCVSSDKPVFLSAHRLSSEIGWNVVSLSKSRFPAARRAVEAVVESKWHFYARRVIWAMLTKRDGSDAAVRALSGIEHHRGRVLIAHFRGIDRSTPLVKGALASLLQQHGIDRHWIGPCPERDFPLAGRAFYRRDRGG